MKLGTTAVLCIVAALVALPQAQGRNAPRITTPKEQFGHDIGDDYFLVNYTQYVEYLQKLDQRVRPHDGRRDRQDRRRAAPSYTAIITSPENHKQLAQYKDINRRLALAEGLTDDQARQLAQRRQGGRLDRRRPARDRGARRAAADRDRSIA